MNHAAHQRRILVVAGTRAQAAVWAEERKLRSAEWVYANPRTMAGLCGVDIVRVGSWAERADIDEIERALAAIYTASTVYAVRGRGVAVAA